MAEAYRRVPGVLEVEVDGDRVLLAPSTLAYFGLNVTGSRIWCLIGDEPTDPEGLVPVLAAEFGVEPAVIRGDVLAFLDAAVDADVMSRG
jgi:hypothetical protein